MPLKKATKAVNQTHTGSFGSFRTIMKSRNNKQTVKQNPLVNQSANFQQKIVRDQQEESKLSRSQVLEVRQVESSNEAATEKIKNYVRNMKERKSRKNPTIYHNQEADRAVSRKSVRSTHSKAASRCNSFIADRDFDAKSVRSNVSQSRVSTSSLYAPGAKPVEEKGIERLNKLEEKMDFLIKHKLKNLMLRAHSKGRVQTRPFMGAQVAPVSAEGNVIEKQMEAILADISSLKEKQTEDALPPAELQEDITQLSKKIELLEKIIASSFTQSEILKKFYFAQKSQKCPHLNRKDKILQEISRRKEMLQTNFSSIEQKKAMHQKRPILKYESTSKYYHGKPSRSAYDIDKVKKNSFSCNRQQMPTRSVYGREFLNYGTLPVFNYKPADNKHSTSKMTFKTSSYQEAFKDKEMHTKQINYKELDCFKNKIKTGNISFAQMYKNKEVKKKKADISQKLKVKQKPALQTDGRSESIQKAMDTISNLQKRAGKDSEMKKQYVWHGKSMKTVENDENHTSNKAYHCSETVAAEYGRTSVIKNSHLNKLKASFKAEFLR